MLRKRLIGTPRYTSLQSAARVQHWGATFGCDVMGRLGLEWITLALLAAYLIGKQRQRARARRTPDELRWPGTAFDARAVWPRIQQLRKDYLAQVLAKPRPGSRREIILASFREAVRQLSFFQNVSKPRVETRQKPETSAAGTG